MKPEIIHVIIFTLVIAAIGLLITLLCGRKTGKKKRFDERQLLAQGLATKVGFYSLMLSLGAYIMYYVFSTVHVLEAPEGIFLCIIMSVMAFALVCIVNDAYIALNVNRRTQIILFGIIGASNILIGVKSIIDGDMIENGVLQFSALNLAIGVMAIVIVLALAIRSAQQKKAAALEAKEDE